MSLSVDTIVTASVSDEQSRLSGMAAGSVWEDIRGSAMSHINKGREHWDDIVLLPIETKYMRERFKGTKEGKKKNGDWWFRKHLPDAYRTAKSVAGTAMELNVVFSSLGKTETEGKIAEKRLENNPDVPKTEREKFGVVMTTAGMIFRNLTTKEKKDADTLYKLNWS